MFLPCVNSQVFDYADCNTGTKGCFGIPGDCARTEDCDTVASFYKVDDTTYHFEIQVYIRTLLRWLRGKVPSSCSRGHEVESWLA